MANPRDGLMIPILLARKTIVARAEDCPEAPTESGPNGALEGRNPVWQGGIE